MSLPRVFAGRRRRLMARLVGNGLGQAAAAFAIAWLVRDALRGAGPDQALRLAPILAALVACGLALFALRALERVDAERLGQEYVTRVRLRLFERTSALPARHRGVARFGLTMTRMVSDLNSVRRWVSVGVARTAVASVSLVGTLAGLAYFDPAAAALAGGLCALGAAIGVALTPALRSQVREARRRRGRLAGSVGETIFASGSIRHHGGTRRELRRLRRQSRRMTRALVRRMRLSGVLRALPDAIFPLAIAGLVLLLAAEGAAASGDLVVTLILLGMLGAPARDLAQAWDYRLSFLEGRRRIGQILSGPRLAEESRALPLAAAGPAALRFRDVCVEGVFRKLTGAAAPGERVLLIGASAAGKSTLLALAARLFDPDAGEVELDGQPLRRLRLDCVEEAVRLVSPDLPLLRGSVAENIGYGLRPRDAERVARTARCCAVGEPSAALPQGLDTLVDEMGRNLAAGLRARISLARALFAQPRLLLIDEPMLLADADARAVLARALEQTDATCVIAAGEEMELAGIDRVWRLEDGALREPAAPPGGGAVRRFARPERVAAPR